MLYRYLLIRLLHLYHAPRDVLMEIFTVNVSKFENNRPSVISG
jgi:hypothetical protein